MITTEQERAIRAIREAEQNSTKIEIFEKNAASAESVIRQKDAKIEELGKAIEKLRKEAIEIEKKFLKKDNTAAVLMHD